MTWQHFSGRHSWARIKLLSAVLVLFVFLPSCTGWRGSMDAAGTATPVRGALSTVAPNVPGAAAAQPAQPTAALNVAGPTAVPTATAAVGATTAGPTAAQIARPGVSTSGFSNLRFTPAADGVAQNEFPAGTEIIFALWDYEGLSAADKIRRIWFRDDQIWITREEPWNWADYGPTGTVRDISIFDNEGDGLHPAVYRLQLYLNDELQVEGTFIVLGE